MNDNCQSCKIKPAEITDGCDNENYPYSLCNDCHQRLLNRSLRPLEYFNLKAQHGVTYLLHDDFYDDDGTASQPVKFEEETDLAFPDVDSVKNDLEQLIDYSIVRWWISKEITNEFSKFNKESVLHSFKKRIEVNNGLGYRIYELTARVLGEVAADWIRNEWKIRTSNFLNNYAECLARCLPLHEGIYYYTEELNKIDSPSELSDKLTGLIHFQSTFSLDWIEQNINRVKNISNSWGLLAVASGLDWPRIKSWLNSGRPLSLVALDALANFSVSSETKNSIIWLRENPQQLAEPDTIDNMNAVLADYLLEDTSPRVRNNINFIINNWNDILK